MGPVSFTFLPFLFLFDLCGRKLNTISSPLLVAVGTRTLSGAVVPFSDGGTRDDDDDTLVLYVSPDSIWDDAKKDWVE
jgi:hypothetical protein